MSDKKSYDASSIKVLEGLEGVRRISETEEARQNFEVIGLSNKVKKKGDVLILSRELKIRPRILSSILNEKRVLSLFPKISKSKAMILAYLRTNREIIKFSENYNLLNTSARELIRLIREWNYKLQNNPLLLISQEEHEFIIGSLMGDSSIRQREKNSCFRFTHSIKQKEYAELKKRILINFNISEFREVKRKIKNHIIEAIDFATKTHPVFNYYRKLFYKEGVKKITKEVLSQINARALSYWVCDDGSYDTTQGYIVLCTNAYTLEDHKLMQQFFNEKFGLNPTIGFRDNKYYFLRFKQEDSKRLIEIIKPFIPSCMNYKIGGKNE